MNRVTTMLHNSQLTTKCLLGIDLSNYVVDDEDEELIVSQENRVLVYLLVRRRAEFIHVVTFLFW